MTLGTSISEIFVKFLELGRVTTIRVPDRERTGNHEAKTIARSRFELLSRDPESRMIDRYTTGLNTLFYCLFLLINLTDMMRPGDYLPHFPHALQTASTGCMESPLLQNGSISARSRL